MYTEERERDGREGERERDGREGERERDGREGERLSIWERQGDKKKRTERERESPRGPPASILCSHCMSVRLSSIFMSSPESSISSARPESSKLRWAGQRGGATALGRLAVSRSACSLSILHGTGGNERQKQLVAT